MSTNQGEMLFGKAIEELKSRVLEDMRNQYPMMTSGDLQTAVLAMTRFWEAYCKMEWEAFVSKFPKINESPDEFCRRMEER